jgi:hypothetical protein
MSDTFGYTAVNDQQQESLRDLNSEFTNLENGIKALVPPGRRQSLALTALEEASMWANKGIAKDWPSDEAELLKASQFGPISDEDRAKLKFRRGAFDRGSAGRS